MAISSITPGISPSIVDLVGDTPLIRLRRIERDLPGVELYAKAEWKNPGGSVKDRPALRMIQEGIASRQLVPGKVTLDACIMNGNGDIGAVSFLERIKHPVSVARAVMEKTPHVLLSGTGAQSFALANGFKLESGELSQDAKKEWREWLKKSRYKPEINIETRRSSPQILQFAPYYFDNGKPNHDTIGVIALDSSSRLAGVVTTSGMAFKMRGRVGDSPIIGAGLFVDNEV